MAPVMIRFFKCFVNYSLIACHSKENPEYPKYLSWGNSNKHTHSSYTAVPVVSVL